jgi:hypothetical protein
LASGWLGMTLTWMLLLLCCIPCAQAL